MKKKILILFYSSLDPAGGMFSSGDFIYQFENCWLSETWLMKLNILWQNIIILNLQFWFLRQRALGRRAETRRMARVRWREEKEEEEEEPPLSHHHQRQAGILWALLWALSAALFQSCSCWLSLRPGLTGRQWGRWVRPPYSTGSHQWEVRPVSLSGGTVLPW